MPALSSAFSPEFARVDPRINAAMATAFDTAQYFHAGQADPERLRILLSATADNVAQWVLLVPDMSYYFDQPVRRPVGGAIVDCIGGIAGSAPGEPTQTSADACVAGLVEAAEKLISASESKCPYCGITKPASLLKNNVWTRGFRDPSKFIKLIISVNVGMYLLSILFDPRSTGLTLHPLVFLSPSDSILKLLGAT